MGYGESECKLKNNLRKVSIKSQISALKLIRVTRDHMLPIFITIQHQRAPQAQLL
jgi:hypothetical protein